MLPLVGRALATPSCNVPPFRVVPPVKVLFPLRTSCPLVTFKPRTPVGAASWIVPPKVDAALPA